MEGTIQTAVDAFVETYRAKCAEYGATERQEVIHSVEAVRPMDPNDYEVVRELLQSQPTEQREAFLERLESFYWAETLALQGDTISRFHNRITDADVQAIFSTISESNIGFLTIDLSVNSITDMGAEAIAKCLEEYSLGMIPPSSHVCVELPFFLMAPCCCIRLSLRGNSITHVGAALLSKASQVSPLNSISLNDCPIGEEGGIALAEAAQKSIWLSEICIGNCRLGTNSIKCLTEAMKINKRMKALDISNPEFCDPSVTVITEMCQYNEGLSSLNICRNPWLGDEGARLLSMKLAKNTFLNSLDVSCNKIGEDGTVHLANRLGTHPTLVELNLSYCRVRNAGAIAIAEALEVNYNVQSLALNHAEIGDEGLEALLNSTKKCILGGSQLNQLRIWGNFFGPHACAALHHILGIPEIQERLAVDCSAYLVDEEPQVSHLPIHRQLGEFQGEM